MDLGATKVTFVADGAVQLHPTGWLPGTTEEVWARRPEFLDEAGYLTASLGGLLVEHGDRALLIDTGFGPREQDGVPGVPVGRIAGGALPANLGRPVDLLAFTHLHVDHTGWALDDAFGHVPVVLPEAEWRTAEQEGAAALAPRVRLTSDGEEIFPGVRMAVTGGHTPGHTIFTITGGGRRLIAFGDALHSPVQVERPDWSSVVDHDADLAAKVRHDLVDALAEPDTTGFGIHFAGANFGHVRDGRWRPLD